jgi:hypothetical protein
MKRLHVHVAVDNIDASIYGSDEPSMPRTAGSCEPAAVATTSARSKCCA